MSLLILLQAAAQIAWGYFGAAVGAGLATIGAGLGVWGVVNLLAGAAFCDPEDEYLSHDSYNFHKRMGYTKVAHMKAIGKKFDRWYDLLWMQKTL